MSNFIKIVVTGVLLFYLLNQLDTQKLLNLLQQASLPWLFIALALEWTCYYIDIIKQMLFLSTKGIRVSLLKLLEYRFIGAFFNNFLPSNIGGDVVRAISLSKYISNAKDSWASIVIARFLGLIVIFPMFFLALTFSQNYFQIHASYIVVSFLILLIGYYLCFIRETSHLKLQSTLTKFSHLPFLGMILSLFNAVSFFRKDYKTLSLGLILSVCYQSLGIIAIYLVSLGLGLEINLSLFFIFIPLIALITMLPISINGLGVQDISFVFLFQKAGVTQEAALAMSFIWHMIRIGATLPGGAAFLTFKLKHSPTKTS